MEQAEWSGSRVRSCTVADGLVGGFVLSSPGWFRGCVAVERVLVALLSFVLELALLSGVVGIAGRQE